MSERGYITESPDDIHNSREPLLRARKMLIEHTQLSAEPIVENLCIRRRNVRAYGQICDVFAKATLQNSQKTVAGLSREKLAHFERRRPVVGLVGRP